MNLGQVHAVRKREDVLFWIAYPLQLRHDGWSRLLFAPWTAL